jgi:succinyl-diaminopimelate desuccinylase
MQESLENTLASLVAIPSVPANSSACRAIMDVVHGELKMFNLSIQTHFDTQNPWLIATTQTTRTPDILFYAHLDVVPGAPHMFHMQKDNEHLLGRGVFDMKFAAACYLEFLRKHSNKLSDLNIGFLFTTDEEKDSACMNEIIATGLRPNVVFMPDGGDNWSIEKRAKGYYAAELVATGKTAHGSRPWEGVSALHTLLDAIKPLREKYIIKGKHNPTLMINGIQSGHAINQIPDYAVAQLDFRSFNRHEMQEYLEVLKEVVELHDNLTLNIHNSGNIIEFDKTSPHVQSFLRTFEQERGEPPVFTDSYGASDARFFASVEVPCIIIEPRGGGRHSNEEWLVASDLALFYQLIEQWIMHDASKSSAPIQHQEKVLV